MQLRRKSREANIYRGVMPNAAWRQHAQGILDSSILLLGDFDAESLRGGEHNLRLGDVHEFVGLFNGDWSEPVVQHFCCRPDGSTCCSSILQTKKKMQASVRQVLVPLWSRVAAGATKKWCEAPRACTATSFVASCHGLMRTATTPWRQRRAAASDSDLSADIIADEDPSKKRKKREHKAGKFWLRRDTANRLMAISIVTQPVRSFLSQCFLSERNSRLFAGSERVRRLVVEAGLGPSEGYSYIGDFVKENGYVDSTAGVIEELLFGESALTRCELFGVVAGTTEASKLLTVHRGLVLRAVGSFNARFVIRLKKPDSFFGLVRACEDPDGDRALTVARAFMNTEDCDAEALFVKRMRAKARESPDGSEQYLLSQRGMMSWAANTPPLLTIASMETSHACFANILSSRGFARVGPGSVLEDSMLGRWRNLSEDRMLSEIESIVLEKARRVATRATKKTKTNQYAASRRGRIVQSVNSSIETALQELTRKRCLPVAARPQKFGTYFYFEQQKLKEAKEQQPGPWPMEQYKAFRDQVRQEWATTIEKVKSDQLKAKNSLAASAPFRARGEIGTPPRKCSRASARLLSEESLDQYVFDVESFENKLGRFSGGVATLAESSGKYVTSKIASKAVRELCLRRDYAGVGGFDTQGLGSRKTASQTCNDRHPGLCRTKDKMIFERARTLAKNLFNMVGALEAPIGEVLIKLVHGDQARFFWPTRKMGNPKVMDFVAASSDGDFVDITRPLIHKTNFSIAADVVSQHHGALDVDCKMSVMVYSSAESRSLSHVKLVEAGEAVRLLSLKQTRPVVNVDPLEEAMRLATTKPRMRPGRKRIKGKRPVKCVDSDGGSALSSSGDAGEDDKSDASAEHVYEFVDPALVPEAPSKPVSSRFYGSLGVTKLDLVHPGRAKCRLCSVKIAATTARLVWQWAQGKPHAYLHPCCAHRLNVDGVSDAYGLMVAALRNPQIKPSQSDDLELAIRLADKRLPKAGGNDIRSRLGSKGQLNRCYVCVSVCATVSQRVHLSARVFSTHQYTPSL